MWAIVERRARRGRRKIGGRVIVWRGIWRSGRRRLLPSVAAMVGVVYLEVGRPVVSIPLVEKFRMMAPSLDAETLRGRGSRGHAEFTTETQCVLFLTFHEPEQFTHEQCLSADLCRVML